MAHVDRQPWACAEVVRGDGCRQQAVRVAARHVEVPLTHVALKYVGVAAWLERVKRLTKPVTKVIWLFIALIPVRAAMRFFDVPGGDYITFVFVIYVMLLFGCVTAVIALQWMAGPRSARQRSVALDMPGPEEEADRLERVGVQLPAATSAQQLNGLLQQTHPSHVELLVRGRLDGGRQLMPGQPLVFEQWEQRGTHVARFFAARPFLVVSDNQPAVFVELQDSAVLLSHYEEVPVTSPRPAADLPLPPELGQFTTRELVAPASGAYKTSLRQGDTVELLVTRIGPSMASVELPFEASSASGGGHYRSEMGRVVVAQCGGHSSLVIRKTG